MTPPRPSSSQSPPLRRNPLLDRPLHVDVVAFSAGIVARDRLSEVIRPVRPRAVDEERVEEHGVARLHHQMHALVERFLCQVLDAMIHLVHSALPLRIPVRQQRLLVRARNDDEASILTVCSLHGSPRTNNLVGRPEREVVKVLV
eukprot:CAMPEP_0196737104 /NCGR_PEP_ID=MMETSP1091-20130531/14938_1 /TAXON_ID=302021 /ORGANISM="Rhodomonas sp., Strain CCMP768" /LENGTH=144 /DNA_ID=CAMNT_0042080909 /DNA_START=141 /DNA_END=576 /DNA_ORIENTATION=-